MKKIKQHYIQIHTAHSVIYWIKLAHTDLAQGKTVTPSTYLTMLYFHLNCMMAFIKKHLQRNPEKYV